MTRGSGQEAPSLHLTRTFAAPAEDVFAAWVSPEVMRRWWHAGPDWTTQDATVDLTLGGRFEVVMLDATGASHRGTGEYTIIERPRRLAWIWHGEGEARTGSVVQIDLVESDGRTTVDLRQWQLPPEAAAEFTIGWNLCLDNLERVVEGVSRP